jgi:hypothetical protein
VPLLGVALFIAAIGAIVPLLGVVLFIVVTLVAA